VPFTANSNGDVDGVVGHSMSFFTAVVVSAIGFVVVQFV
jgi:hypothetical protein